MNRRILVVVGCLIAFTCVSFAQDVIVTKDSKRINAKVEEVNVDNIRYKNFENLEGPTYTLPKSDILSIVYQNGQTESFGAETQKLMMADQVNINTKPSMRTGDPLLYRQYKSGKTMKTGGVALMITGTSLCVMGVIRLNEIHRERKWAKEYGDAPEVYSYFPDAMYLIGGICSLAGGVYLFSAGHKKQNNALNQYYTSQSSTPHIQLNFNPNSVGLAYVF